MPAAAGEEAQHASVEEIEEALTGLTPDDHAKLLLIARGFCKSRHLSTSVMEPEELLAEAFARTLQREKKWNKRVSIIKHLDRAMENISGHLVRERKKIDAFPEGLEPSLEQRGSVETVGGADETLISAEEARILLAEIFGDDKEAARIFELRLDGFQASEIQANLGIDPLKYEAIAKRIRRKIALHLNQK
jgi:DNA-directed RNA polymerase specialized sigma24 family protein